MTNELAGASPVLSAELGLEPERDDDANPSSPRVTDPPKELWLVYGDIERDCTHWECCRGGDVSWCEDKQYPSDQCYVHESVLHAAQELADSESTRAVECLRRARKAEAEIADAVHAMRAYARDNPRHQYRGETQDPNGVHAWLARNDRPNVQVKGPSRLAGEGPL